MDRNAQILLDRLNFDANAKNIEQIREFQISIYQFKFDNPLEGELMTEFTGYIRTLEMTKLKAVMQIWVWLYQHEAQFQMRFGYDRNKSFIYNIMNLSKPRTIRKLLLSHGHDKLMNCQPDMVPEGLI